MNHFKQVNLFDPDENTKTVHVYGVGSFGSHVVVGLAKTGFKNIKVYDYDDVEVGNIPSQFFPDEKHCVGKKKTETLKELTHYLTGTTIEIENVKITKDFQFSTTIDDVHIMCFDNIEAREEVLKALKDYSVDVIDGRVGGYGWEVYYFNPLKNYDDFKKTLQGDFSEAECGSKGLWGVNSLISAKIVSKVVKLSQGKPLTAFEKGSLMSPFTISKKDLGGNENV